MRAKGISCYQCCAYQFAATYDSDSQFEEKLYFKDGKHFSMGSWQVVSLNCPRAAYLARGDDELLFEYLRELMDTAVEIFKVKREWMNQIIKNHRMPFATQQPRDPITGEKGSVAVDLEGLVYTIGVVGVNEMVQFHTGKQMHESRGGLEAGCAGHDGDGDLCQKALHAARHDHRPGADTCRDHRPALRGLRPHPRGVPGLCREGGQRRPGCREEECAEDARSARLLHQRHSSAARRRCAPSSRGQSSSMSSSP